MTEEQKVGGILDGITQILVNNSDLPAALKGPLTDLDAAMAKWLTASNALHVASGEIVAAMEATQNTLIAFEAVLNKYGINSR